MNPPDDSLLCPITLELFRDPVLAQDGHTYERHAIVEWIQKNGTSPITGKRLSLEHLYPNYAIKKAVDHFETSSKKKNYQYIIDIDVRKKAGRPLFQTFGKTIYHAQWLATNEHRPEIILLKIDGARAKKEASFYVDLSRHPHIVRTYGLVHERNNDDDDDNNDNNTIMLLQEYAPMGSLYELLQERRKASDEKILVEIFLQIIDAMSFLAFNNVVHGDLACRNVLIFRFDESNSKNIIAKVTDFGLSRHSKLYSLTPGAAKTTLNIIPIRYAAPEILAINVTPDDYTEKSDVYSMGILMWEAYSRGAIPWSKIESDNEVIRRVTNGELLQKPSNCGELYWSIMCKTWSKSPNDRPTFTELKRLLMEQYYHTSAVSSDSEPYTVPLSSSHEEFKSVQAEFLDGWPNELRSEVRIEAIHKINNTSLESRYQQFIHSNPKFANRECIGWHGTSAKCHNGQCMSSICSLCQIIRNGFRKECARKDTYSYSCWGEASYFANRSFVCHTYNGGSQVNSSTLKRCTIMAKINYGNTFNREKYQQLYDKLVGGTSAEASIPSLLNRLKYDTVATFSRNYYIAPADYILVYNNVAVVPIYIVVYSVGTKNLQIRTTSGKYCSFHNEYHICSTSCDGHYGPECLGSHRVRDNIIPCYNGIPHESKSYGIVGGVTSELIEELTADSVS